MLTWNEITQNFYIGYLHVIAMMSSCKIANKIASVES